MLSAIGNLIGTVMTNEANSGENYLNRVWSEDMWRKNNEYNTPANQVKRLREGNVNPHFAMQNGSLGTGTSSTPPSQPSPIAYDFSPIGEGVSRSLELFMQKQLNDAEVDYKNQQAQNWSIKNITQLWDDYVRIDNAIKSGKLTDQEIGLAKLRKKELWTNLQTLSKENQIRIDKIQSEKDLNEARARGEDARTAYQTIINGFAPRQQAIITSNLQKEGSEIDSRVRKNDREGALASANEALSNAQRSGVIIDNVTKSKMAEYIVDEKFAQADEARFRAANERKQYYGGRVGHELPTTGYGNSSNYNRNIAPPSRR